MGCCVSSNKASPSPSSPRKDHAVVAQPPKPSERSIAPPHAEEETVKEVLSETPKWKNPTTATKSEPQKPPCQNKTLHKLQEGEEEEENKDEKKASLLVNKAQEEETSEVSEVCSLISETISMSTTTTATEQKEEKAEQTRKRVIRSPTKLHKNRSFSGDLGVKRERKGHASRNNGVGSARLAQCRDKAGQRMVNGGTRNQPRRRDPGETSFGRSRSPSTLSGHGAARSVMGRCPSARRTNGSPAKAARAAPPENGRRKMEVPAREGKWGCANETLENPLVSLECFIFI